LSRNYLTTLDEFRTSPHIDHRETGQRRRSGFPGHAGPGGCLLAGAGAFMDTDLVPPDEAIARALGQDEVPVIISDLADGN
jgi:hypothetical protein